MAEADVRARIKVEGEEDLLQVFNTMRKVFRETGTDVKAANDVLRDYSGSVYGARRSIMLLRTEVRQQHAEWLELGRVLRDIGRIGRNITQMWQAYSIAQMRVADATDRVNKSQANVMMLQTKVNMMRRAGKESTEEYLEAQLLLNNAVGDEESARRRLDKAHSDNIIGYIGMGLQLADIVSTMIILNVHMKTLSGLLDINAIKTAALTVKEYAHTVSLWSKAAALTVVHALSNPYFLAVAGVAAAAGLTWVATQQSKTQQTRDVGGEIPETGWYYLREREQVLTEQETRSRKESGYSIKSKDGSGNVYHIATLYVTLPNVTKARQFLTEFDSNLRRRGAL